MTLKFTEGEGAEPVAARDDHRAATAFGLYRRVGKRLCDIAFVILVSPVALMLVAVIAGATLISRQAPFYAQQRIGRHGRSFRILKIQTMVPNADAVLDAILTADPDARREWAETQKLGRDPRITPLGVFLRRTYLDEVPQLWNVLRGDMSIVGPRPMLESQRKLYPGQAYAGLRPGMTGLWQVCDRDDGGFARRAALDARYARDLGFLADLRILGRTVGMVLRCTGR